AVMSVATRSCRQLGLSAYWSLCHCCLPSFPTRRSSDLDENIRWATAAELAWAVVVLVSGMHVQAEQIHDIAERAHAAGKVVVLRSEEHTSELQSLAYLVCRLLLQKK